MRITDSWPVTLHESGGTTAKLTRWGFTQRSLGTSKTSTLAIWGPISWPACPKADTWIMVIPITQGHTLPGHRIQVEMPPWKTAASIWTCGVFSQKKLMRTIISQKVFPMKTFCFIWQAGNQEFSVLGFAMKTKNLPATAISSRNIFLARNAISVHFLIEKHQSVPVIDVSSRTRLYFPWDSRCVCFPH